MESKKINQLATNLAPVSTDLTVVGNPTTGELKKITLQQIASLFGGITSIGMVVPSGFSVSPATLTASGTFTISGAGTTAQYIRGDGSLATFPTFLSSDKLIQEVRNNSGATMLKGTIVYINGAVGNKATIAKALATTNALSSQTYGVVQDDISNNSNGYVVVVGEVIGLDTSALTEGQQLYLSGTVAGFYTVTKPYAPTHLVYVAVVLRSHPTLGVLGVKIQNGYELSEIHDCSVVTPSNNDGLFYESSTSLWKNKSIATILGYTPVTSARTISTTSPLSGGGDLTANRTLSIAQATTSVSGYLSSTDWNTFNNKQGTITLTTTGSSGASTFVTGTLNVPTYTLTGLGGQPLATNLTSLAGLTFASTSFVKMTATGTFSLDTATYLTGNQSITLSGDISGTGTTAITTAIGSNKVTNAMLAQVVTASFLGRVTSATGNVETLTGTQATTLLDVFSSSLKGLAPASAGGTSNFLRADGTWAAPSGVGFANPMTLLGDIIYGGTSGAATRLAGNTTATKQFLSQTGTGTISAIPSWSAIAGSDITGAALTKTDDTNVTLTLGGTPATSLLRAASITIGWTGTLADARITSAATWNAKESALTFSSPLSRATNTISIPAATTSVNGYLTSTDWTTFNGKFTLPALTSGSVLFSNGTTISQNNAQFFWDNTNNRLGIGTTTPANNLDVVRGTAGTMARGFYESASVSYNADTKFGIYTASATATDGAALYLGQTNLLNSSSQYGGFELQYRYNSSTTENLRINYVSRLATGAVSTSTSDLLLISKTGAATFLSTVTATSFVKTSGTSAQILAADGSVITAGTNITISGATISSSNIYTTDGTLTSARTITAAGFGLTYSDNKNGQASITISNTTAGTSSAAGLIMTSDASSGYGLIAKISSTYTTSALVTTNDLALINYTAGDIILLNTFATGLIKFGVGTSTSAQMTLTNDGHLLIGTTTNGTYFLDVNGNSNIGGCLFVTYPNTLRASINFATGGTLRNLPLTGDMEMDGTGKLYFTHNDTERGVIPAYQFFKPNANITLVSQTAAQPIFNTITNGAVSLKGSTNYVFEMLLYITGMSTTSGTFGIAFGGSATLTTIAWQSLGSKVNNIATTASHQSTFNVTTSNATLVTASAFATGYIRVWGNVKINAGGTFIPQITLGVAAAASINSQSYFRITALSAGSVDYIGNWS